MEAFMGEETSFLKNYLFLANQIFQQTNLGRVTHALEINELEWRGPRKEWFQWAYILFQVGGIGGDSAYLSKSLFPNLTPKVAFHKKVLNRLLYL